MDEKRGTPSAVCQAWDNSECTGSEFCQPRCPRFFDDEGTALIVRPYQRDDRDALTAMYDEIESSRGTFGLPPRSDSDTGVWLDRLTSKGWNLVACHDSRVVGHVGLAPARSTNPHLLVFVRPTYQDRGIGSELVKHLIAYAENRDHESLELSVARTNDRMLTVATNLGFNVVDKLPIHYSLQLSLEAPNARRVQRPPIERD